MPNEQLSLCIIFGATGRALRWIYIYYWLEVWGCQSPAENGFDAFWAPTKNTSGGKSINNFLLLSPLLLIRPIFCSFPQKLIIFLHIFTRVQYVVGPRSTIFARVRTPGLSQDQCLCSNVHCLSRTFIRVGYRLGVTKKLKAQEYQQ